VLRLSGRGTGWRRWGPLGLGLGRTERGVRAVWWGGGAGGFCTPPITFHGRGGGAGCVGAFLGTVGPGGGLVGRWVVFRCVGAEIGPAGCAWAGAGFSRLGPSSRGGVGGGSEGLARVVAVGGGGPEGRRGGRGVGL